MSVVSRRRRKPEINIVPLIDVLAILIFFFLLTMKFRDIAAINLALPKIETAGVTTVDRTLIVGIDNEGQLFIDGNEVTRPEFTAFFQTLQERGVARDLPVLIMADENTPIKDITFVIDTCRKVGLEKYRLQSAPLSGPASPE